MMCDTIHTTEPNIVHFSLNGYSVKPNGLISPLKKVRNS